MNIDDLTPEQKEKVGNCHTPEEILSLAKQEGYELSEEEMEQISGGKKAWNTTDCPKCGYPMTAHKNAAICEKCGYAQNA